ncbi:MAG: hypothetical protein IT337_03730 [Thermomicrobiales bacterium]|nr:hypothetical protein [Thermomicrobiales bacterium]
MRGSTLGGAVVAAAVAAGVVAFVNAQFYPDRWERTRFAALVQVEKNLANPLALRIARSGASFPLVVEHVGRRSGRRYETPVAGAAIPGGFLIPVLQPGRIDWIRNVRTAGGAVVIQGGRRIPVAQPRLVPAAAALPLLDERWRQLWSRLGIAEFLRLEVAVAPPA